MIVLLAAAALAAEPVTGSVHGDVKAFVFAGFPYDNPLIPSDPFATGIADGRLKLAASASVFHFEGHHAITLRTTGTTVPLGPSSGIVTQVPEAVPLTWVAYDETIYLGGRTDRLSVSADLGPTRITLGRQPISFGHGLMFTPLDLVGPFNPAVVDQEYKPGYDALRFDAFWGVSGRATALAAYTSDQLGTSYAAEWGLPGLALVAYGQHTIGVTDIGLFFGELQTDEVFGATVSTSIGPVGVYSDAALTLSEVDDTFFRGTVGALWRPTPTTTLTGEFYVQTLGAADPADYYAFSTNDRFARGELWLLGRYYAGVAVSQEITPLLIGSLSLIGNLADPSAFLGPTIAWSLADNAEVDAGAFFGIGKRPDGIEPRSEFGLYPITAFVETKAYF